MLSATLKYAQLCTEWINISEAKRVIEITIQLLDVRLTFKIRF